MTDQISEDNPLKETQADRIERELHNIYHVLSGIDRRLDELGSKVDRNFWKLDELEETISFFAYIPTRGLFLYYDHKKQDLYLQRNLLMHFDGDEADVLCLMFRKKDGRPLKKKFYCAEVAEKLAERNREQPKSPNSIFQTIKRIQDKLDKKYRVGQIFTVTTKEFYFTRKTNPK